MRILIIGGISQSLVNFRGPLIRAMLDQGHEVIACAGEPLPDVAETLKEWGVLFIPVPLARAGMSPFGDLQTFRALCGIMREQRPDIVMAYTIKPVIWGGLAARSCRIHTVFSLITGLGYAFMEEQATDCRLQTADSPDSIKPRTALKQRLAGWVAKRLYKASLKHSRRVFFQNPDDRDAFVKLGLVRQDKTVVVSGSGVDVDHFHEATDRRPQTASFLNYKEPRTTSQKPTPTHSLTHKPTRPQISFLLIARLLRDKGIREYAEAAAMIKRDLPAAEFHLVGCYDPNPSGLKPNEVDAWVKAGTIICHGHQPEVRPFFRNCDVYVLPSYREGTPRTVLEAMATGRAIITTDAPGCRETIRFQAEGRRLKPEEPPLPCETTARHAEDVLYNEERRTNNQELFTIGTNGILIPPRDAESLADAMRFFINNPEQIATMGRESRRYAEERYDVRKVNAVMLKEMGLLETVAGAPVMHPLSVGTHAPAVPPS